VCFLSTIILASVFDVNAAKEGNPMQQTAPTRALDWLIGAPRSFAMSFAWAVLFFAGVLSYWEYFGIGHIYVFPPPSLTGAYIWDQAERLLYDARVSALHVFVGLIIGGLVGFPLGITVAIVRPVEKTALLLLGFMLAYPKLGVVLIMAQWLHHSEIAVYAFNIWVAFLFHVLLGFRGARAVLSEKGGMPKDTVFATTMYFKNRWELFVHYALPLSLPHFFSALLMSSAVLWPLLIFSESSVSPNNPGLGTLAFNSGDSDIRMEAFFAATGAIAVCNFLTWLLIRLLEKLVTRA